jgi:phosphoribosyl 1,2-cyclic phosphate phosphodiesterase
MARAVIPAYMEAEGMASITRRFEYAFKAPPPDFGWFRPALEGVEVPINSTVMIAGVEVRFFPQVHGRIRSMGVRMGNIAYSTDCNYLPEEAFAALEGVEIWVVDCLRHTQAPTHAHLPLSLEWIARVKPRLAVLTHLAHEMEYNSLSAQLPEGVVVGVDGMRLKAD